MEELRKYAKKAKTALKNENLKHVIYAVKRADGNILIYNWLKKFTSDKEFESCVRAFHEFENDIVIYAVHA